MKLILCLPVLALVVVAAGGCSDAPEPPQQAVKKTIAVKSTDYGSEWPLLAGEAVIGCEPPSIAFIEIGGRRCALNGKAISSGMERCDDASKTGNAVAFGLFVEKALALCPGRQ